MCPIELASVASMVWSLEEGIEGKGVRLMSGEFHDEFDPFEYAEQLGYTDQLTRGDHTDPQAIRAETPGSRALSRRELIVKGGIGAAAVAGLGATAGRAGAATEAADQYTGTLNVITLGVEWPPGAEQQAEKDLGVKFNVQLMGTNAQVQRGITAPRVITFSVPVY